jgi:hypothetical protein
LKNRLRQYFHLGPTQRTNIRILHLVGDRCDFEVAVAPTGPIPDAKFLEPTPHMSHSTANSSHNCVRAFSLWVEDEVTITVQLATASCTDQFSKQHSQSENALAVASLKFTT